MCIEYHCYIMLINKLFDCEVLKDTLNLSFKVNASVIL